MVRTKIILATILIISANFIFALDFEKEDMEITATEWDNVVVDKTIDTTFTEKTLESEDHVVIIVKKESIEEREKDHAAAEKIADIDPDSDETHCCYTVRELIEKGLAGLGTAKGATGVACFTGITQGALNFGWAFNWAKHAGFDPDMSMKVQEICGIVSAFEILFLGALFPYILHKYTQNIQAAAAKTDE